VYKFNEPIDTEFERIYGLFSQSQLVFDSQFKQGCFNFFAQHNNAQDHWELHDHFFENLGPLWYKIESRRMIIFPKEHVEKIFDTVLEIVYEWESNNAPNTIHKGTIYYFYGVVCILNGEIEKGCLLMHQASNEDGNLNRVGTPSKSFISLNDLNTKQFFKNKVTTTVSFLKTFIDSYNSITNSSFDISDLRRDFLTKDEYEEKAFFFIFCIYKLENMYHRIHKKIKSNQLASFIETTIIFEFCKLFESILCKYYPGKLINSIPSFCSDPAVSLRIEKRDLEILNHDQKTDFANVVTGLLNKSYQNPLLIQSPSDMECDLALVYVLRNFGGHRIQNHDVIRDNFEPLMNATLHSIILVIDKKYS